MRWVTYSAFVDLITGVEEEAWGFCVRVKNLPTQRRHSTIGKTITKGPDAVFTDGRHLFLQSCGLCVSSEAPCDTMSSNALARHLAIWDLRAHQTCYSWFAVPSVKFRKTPHMICRQCRQIHQSFLRRQHRGPACLYQRLLSAVLQGCTVCAERHSCLRGADLQLRLDPPGQPREGSVVYMWCKQVPGPPSVVHKRIAQLWICVSVICTLQHLSPNGCCLSGRGQSQPQTQHSQLHSA